MVEQGARPVESDPHRVEISLARVPTRARVARRRRYRMAIQGYDALDATALAELVRKKELHPSELVEETVSRIHAVNPKLNAVVHEMHDQARKTAAGPLPEGPFTGVPFVVKDLDGYVAGVPFTGSCKAP